MEPDDKQDAPPVDWLSTKDDPGIPRPDSPRVEVWREMKKPDDELDDAPFNFEDLLNIIGDIAGFAFLAGFLGITAVTMVWAIGLGIWRTIFGWP